jgi:hypothetical protein
MYRALVESNPTHNLVFSPINAASSLAMIFLGARWARASTYFEFYYLFRNTQSKGLF